jgi:hypothetical protein
MMWANWLVPGMALAVVGGAVVWLILLAIVLDAINGRHDRRRAPDAPSYPAERSEDRLPAVH